MDSELSCSYCTLSVVTYAPPTDGKSLTIYANLKSFEGPALNCRVSTTLVCINESLIESVIDEIRNNASAIVQTPALDALRVPRWGWSARHFLEELSLLFP